MRISRGWMVVGGRWWVVGIHTENYDLEGSRESSWDLCAVPRTFGAFRWQPRCASENDLVDPAAEPTPRRFRKLLRFAAFVLSHVVTGSQHQPAFICHMLS